MFERFTEDARQVVVLAQEEARGLRHNYIGTEHILLGLLRVEDGVAARVLESLDVTLDEVRAQVARIVGEGDEVTTGQIPFTPRAKKVLELAPREAVSLGHRFVGTEHILLGLAREQDDVAARILLDFGADAETIRAEVEWMLENPKAVSGAAYAVLDDDEVDRLLVAHGRVLGEFEAAIESQDFERAAALGGRIRELAFKLGPGYLRLTHLPTWEYEIVKRGVDIERLNELGAAGWELVAIVGGQGILKRIRRAAVEATHFAAPLDSPS
jgi:hypothetical protein